MKEEKEPNNMSSQIPRSNIPHSELAPLEVWDASLLALLKLPSSLIPVSVAAGPDEQRRRASCWSHSVQPACLSHKATQQNVLPEAGGLLHHLSSKEKDTTAILIFVLFFLSIIHQD